MSLRVLRSRVVSFLKPPFWINSRFCHYRRPSPLSTPAAVCNFIRGDLSKTAAAEAAGFSRSGRRRRRSQSREIGGNCFGGREKLIWWLGKGGEREKEIDRQIDSCVYVQGRGGIEAE